MTRIPLSFVAFAGFGIFWGTWGAALPAMRETAELSDAELGGALLFVGLGALPAMLFTGRAVDRFGTRITGLLLICLAIAGLLVALFGQNLLAVAAGMTLVGATSGASDVAANALAGVEEARSRRQVITLAHAVFSSFVVVASLGSAALFGVGGGAQTVFLIAAFAIVASGVVVAARGSGPEDAGAPAPASQAESQVPMPRRSLTPLLPFVAVGAVGALGFAAENAHQSWGAIYLAGELNASPALAAIAPATFAACAALTRFAVGFSNGLPATVLLMGGAATAVVGALVIAVAGSIGVALLGLALAAGGTSVLFPTLLSRALRGVPDSTRGRATSTVATTAYLGFLFGPVYVGLLAGAVGLRGAMVGIAVLAAAFGVLAPLVLRLRAFDALDESAVRKN